MQLPQAGLGWKFKDNIKTNKQTKLRAEKCGRKQPGEGKTWPPPVCKLHFAAAPPTPHRVTPQSPSGSFLSCPRANEDRAPWASGAPCRSPGTLLSLCFMLPLRLCLTFTVETWVQQTAPATGFAKCVLLGTILK